MPIEIEIKLALREEQVIAVERSLAEANVEHNAEHVADQRHVDHFFDTRSFALKQADRGLRLRLESPLTDPCGLEAPPERVTLTHKGPPAHGALHSRDEHEMQLSGEDAAARAIAWLASMGYQRFLSFEKHRRAWRLNECEVAIDRLPHLGVFVEIECVASEDLPDEAKEAAVLATRDGLALSEAPRVHQSYPALMVAHCQAHGLALLDIEL